MSPKKWWLEELHHDSWEIVTQVLQVSNEKNPGCLGYVGDYTTQLYWDYNKPW